MVFPILSVALKMRAPGKGLVALLDVTGGAAGRVNPQSAEIAPECDRAPCKGKPNQVAARTRSILKVWTREILTQ